MSCHSCHVIYGSVMVDAYGLDHFQKKPPGSILPGFGGDVLPEAQFSLLTALKINYLFIGTAKLFFLYAL